MSRPYSGLPVTIESTSTAFVRVPMILKSFGSLSLSVAGSGGVSAAAFAASSP